MPELELSECDKCDVCKSLCDSLNAAIELYNVMLGEGSAYAPSQLIAVAKAGTALVDCHAYARAHKLTLCPGGTGTTGTGHPKNCPPCPPCPACKKEESLTILGVEQTQATQYWNLPAGAGSEPPNFDNTVPLVNNKATVLRVYVDATTTQSITGSLNINQGAFFHGPATNNAPLGRIAGIHAASINRNQVDDTLNFLLPAAVCTGMIGGILTVQTANASVVVSQNVELSFQPGLPLHLHVVQVQTPTSMAMTPTPLFDFVQRAFPVSQFSSSTSTLQWPVEVDTLDQFMQVLIQISTIRAMLVYPGQTVIAVGNIQGTPGLNYGAGVGANLCALFYAGNIATDGAHWVARSLGLSAADCDNPSNLPASADLQLTFNEVQSRVGVILDTVGTSPNLTPANDQIVSGASFSHTTSQGPVASGSQGTATTTFEATFDDTTNTLKLDGMVHVDGIGNNVNTSSKASTRTEAYVGTTSSQSYEVSFAITNTAAILNYSKYDTFGAGHGRFDLKVWRIDGSTFVQKYSWGADQTLPDSGFLIIPQGSYVISYSLTVGAGSETGQPLNSNPSLNAYSEDRSAGITFQFITGDVPSTALPGATGLIPETGFDDVLLRTYPTTDFYDLMTACNPRWISPETYTGILQKGSSLIGHRVTGPVFQGVFRVSWQGGDAMPQVTLSQWLRLDVAERLPTEKSDLSLEALDANGRVMTVIHATRLPNPLEDATSASLGGEAWFRTVVPTTQAIASVRPVFQGKPLELISIKTSQLKIELSPPKLDPKAGVLHLKLNVQGVSDDSAIRWAVRCHAGEAWFPVVAGVGAPGELTIPIDELPAGDQWQFEAIAYAGMKSATTQSTAIRALPPVTKMRIVYPASGTEIHQGEVLRLFAIMSPSIVATIMDDVVWTSSAAGTVASGLSTSTQSLPPGRQQIKVSTVLPSGELAEDTVFVSVVRGRACGCKTGKAVTKSGACGCHK